jgi:chromosome segregation ATPase
VPGLNLDLPQEILDEVSRLAQKFNVHRADVLVRAVQALVKSFPLEEESAGLKNRLAEAAREKESLGEWLKAQTAAAGHLAEERDALGRQVADLAEETGALKRDLSEIRVAADGLAQELKNTIAERDTAVKLTRELEEKDRQKVLSVMRDGEVDKLRKHAREIAMHVQELEKELAYQRMEAGVMKKKIESLSRQLAITLKQKKEIDAGFLVQQKDTFKSDRQIGRLLKERADLRAELHKLASLLHKGSGPPPKPPASKAGAQPKAP